MNSISIIELGAYQFPSSADLSILTKPVTVPGEGITLRNPLVIQPLEGADFAPDGSPTEYTHRRYQRYFGSNAGLVWFESLAVTEDGRSYPSASWITPKNLDAFKRLVHPLKEAYPDTVFVAQLTHAGRFAKPHGSPAPVVATHNPHYNSRVPLVPGYPVVTDEYLDRLTEHFVMGAELCRQAGFDGVDVKACHGYLLSELLSAFNREGRYGGCFENRARMLLQTIEAIKAQQGNDLLVSSRICHADATPYPFGFGVKTDGSLEPDYTEPIRLVNKMHARGVNLVNLSTPRVTVNPEATKLTEADLPSDAPDSYFNRFYQGTKALTAACPAVLFVGSGYTQPKHLGPQIAAAALANGDVGLVGFGRMANACPDFIKDLAAGNGKGAAARKVCTLCGNCYKLLRAGRPTGCPTRDTGVFLPLLLEVLER